MPTFASTGLSESAVEEANKSVSKALERKREGAGCKRKATQHSDKMRAKLGKYTPVHGVAAAQRHFKKKFDDLPESTLSTNVCIRNSLQCVPRGTTPMRLPL